MNLEPVHSEAKYVVVGSGPAAIAAAKGIIAQGHKVTILDVGTRLDTQRQEVVDRMSLETPEAWNPDDVATISGNRVATQEAIHSKKVFGSAFSFDSRDAAVDVRWEKNSGFNHSLARGGLSNVWGSSLLPYCQADIPDWPINLTDLEPHYRAIMDFMPCTNGTADLEAILPSYSSQKNSIELSTQGASLLDDLDRYNRRFKEDGILYGRARLAIRASGGERHRECQYCALCLSGCPYGLIYSSAHTLQDLIDAGEVTYLADHLVEKVDSSDDQVTITGRDLSNGKPFSIRAERLFIGAGVLPSARIVLNSLQLFDVPVTLLDSQYFIYPLLRLKGTDRVENERMHTTSQLFMELSDPSISRHLVHLQIYGYSSFLHSELNRTFLKWLLHINAFRRWFLGRLMIVQGFVHSKDSGTVRLILRKDASGKIHLSATSNSSRHALATVLRVGLKLTKNALKLKALPLLPGLKFPKPGSGYHNGGTFPMRETPGKLETDTLGRLPSWPRVHLVDSSVFPSIPATSITMSVMANAHRIATKACMLDAL
ncbi:MAG: GMC oxidoreductase [Verrucomicrobiota bacterium]